jgi:hypothetical protein
MGKNWLYHDGFQGISPTLHSAEHFMKEIFVSLNGSFEALMKWTELFWSFPCNFSAWAELPVLGRLPLALMLVTFGQLALVLQVYPYPLSYYNPLLGGRTKAPQVMNVGWGEGYDLAADYLNHKPDAQQLVAMASMGHGAFSFYFDGRAEWMDLSKIAEVDYVVIYIEHQQRCVPEVWCRVLDGVQPEKVIEIGGVPYAWIYDQHRFTPEIRQQVLEAGTD